MHRTLHRRRFPPQKSSTRRWGSPKSSPIETAINIVQEKTDAKKLLLLVNSSGGLVQSSYKIARALRKAFSEIIVFVPHIAASGGTLLALTGNQIVMGVMSQLSPLDPQATVGDGAISQTLLSTPTSLSQDSLTTSRWRMHPTVIRLSRTNATA